MKILITGGGGFIGSHLVEHCVKCGYDVKAFVHYNADNHWGWLETSDIKNDIEVILGDIRDYDSVYPATKSIDIILHLAALIGIPYSYISPLGYIKTNIVGTYNILECAKNRNVEQVLITSTSETYGTAQYVPIDESHPVLGQSPYAASKIGADQLSLSYFCAFNLPVKVVRPFNTYGPRQSARSIIPAIITQILNGKKEIELGNLSPTRDFTFVEDTVNGFTEILNSSSLLGEVTNIGMNEEISIRDLVNSIIELMNKKIKVIPDKYRMRSKLSEVGRLRCDNAKLLEKTAWKPKYDLRKGLLRTINWMAENLKFYKPEIYNI